MVKEFRERMLAWRDWKLGAGELTPEVERIEAVYQSDLLPPSLQQLVHLVYLDPRLAKQKYRSVSPTVYYAKRQIAEELMEHLAGKLGETVH